ncbi:MAG: TolB family protein [Gemmatimonadaceae bacterium]
MSVSHDGKWLAYDSNLNGNGDIYKVPVGGGDAQQLTHDPADGPVGQPGAGQVLTRDICPFPGGFVWSADSELIYYCAEHNGLRSFRVMPSVGGPSKLLLELSDPLRQLYRGIFAVDQGHIYFTVGSRESDIWVMELNRK